MLSLSQIKYTLILPRSLVRRLLTDVLMIHASSQRSYPQAFYELYDNQLQCVRFSHGTRHFQQCVLLSCYHHIVSWHSGGKPISINKFLIQISSNVTFAIAQYSDSALDREKPLCFLLFHYTRFPQRKTISCGRPRIKRAPLLSLHMRN